jgi:hypothetical protein
VKFFNREIHFLANLEKSVLIIEQIPLTFLLSVPTYLPLLQET